MIAWLQSLTPRERLIVVGGAVLAALTGLYLLVAEPMWERLQAERARLEAQTQLLAWMRQSAAQVAQLRSSTSVARNSGRPPYLLLDAAVRRTGLPAPQRLEPRGRDGAAVQFEDVAFERLLLMLAELEREGELRIADVSLTRRSAGTVNASIVLERTP